MKFINLIFVVALCHGISFAQDSLAFQRAQNELQVEEISQFQINANEFFGQVALANEGGPLQQMIFGNINRDIGFKSNAYLGYVRNRMQFPFSKYDRFTNVSYMPTNDEGQYISAYHSQRYKQFSFALDYSKIVSDGFFIDQKARHANTTLLFKYHPTDSRYSAQAYILFNKMSAAENGGLASDSLYIDEAFSSEKVYPMRLTNAKLEQWNREFELEQRYSLQKSEMAFSDYSYLKLRSGYLSQKELYVDSDPDYRATVEGVLQDIYYPLIIDSTETRDSVGFTRYYQSLDWNYGIKALLDARVGYHYAWDNFTTGIIREKQDIHGLSLDLDILKSLVKLKLNSEYSDLFDERATSWTLASEIVKDFELGYAVQKNFPELIQRSYLGNHNYWSNDFALTESERLYLILKDPKHYFALRVNYFKLKNRIFYNSEARPEQILEEEELIQVQLDKNFHWRKWHSTLQTVWQNTESDKIALPDWLIRCRLYYQDQVFGNNTLQLGAQLNYFSKYYSPSYMAPQSTFYIANGEEQGDYPMLDIFMNVQVKSLKAFFIYENVSQLFAGNESFVAPHYTWKEPRIKLGISWNFYDK